MRTKHSDTNFFEHGIKGSMIDVVCVRDIALNKFRNCDFDGALKALEYNLFRDDYDRPSIDIWLSILKKLNKLDYAVLILEDLLLKHPNSIEFYYGIGTVFYMVGRFQESLNAYKKCLELSPDNYRILNSLAKTQLVLGNISDAVEYSRASIKICTQNPEALRIISLEHSFELDDFYYLTLIKANKSYAEYNLRDQVQLNYALAKAYLDVGKDKKAFDQYKIAGATYKKTKKFDKKRTQEIYDSLIKIVTKKRLVATREQGSSSHTPIFIIGMPRSGTTLLEQILNAHPGIKGVGEQLYLGKVVHGMRFGEYQLNIGQPDPVFTYESSVTWQQRGEAYIEYISRLANANNSTKLVDKMPGNYHYVGMINALFPNSKIIHCLRHPMDVCFSCYKTLFSDGHEWSFDLDDIAFQYRQYWKVMDHWKREFPDLMYPIYYENVVTNTQSEIFELLRFLGVEWNDACLSFHNEKTIVKTASLTQVRKPIYQSSTNSWQRYEKYLGPLAEQLSDIISEYELMLQNSRNNG